MNANNLGEAFLREIGAEARRFHVPTDMPEDLPVCHSFLKPYPFCC